MHNSADSVHMGHITKRGPQDLRTAFVQVAMGIIRQPKKTADWKLMKDYQLMKANKGSGRAIIALTRKVARIVFAMLNNHGKSYGAGIGAGEDADGGYCSIDGNSTVEAVAGKDGLEYLSATATITVLQVPQPELCLYRAR